MDEFDAPFEKATPFLRAVLSANSETLEKGSRPARSEVCASLLAVSHPHALAISALGDCLSVTRLDKSTTFATTRSVSLPSPARAVYCPESNPSIVIVLLDAHCASAAIRGFDLHALSQLGVLEEVDGFHLYANEDGDASVVSMQVADMGAMGGSAEVYMCVAFDNGNAGIYRLGGTETPMSSLRVHTASAASGSAALCVAAVPVTRSGFDAKASVVAVGSGQGRILLYKVILPGSVELTGTFTELMSGWAPQYLGFLSNTDLLVAYKNDGDQVHNAVVFLDDRGSLLSDRPDSARHLGEVCFPSLGNDGDSSSSFVMAMSIPTWPLAVVAFSKSTDVEFLGSVIGDGYDSDGDPERWRVWKPDEGQTIVMPGDDKDDETFPIGIAFNLTNTSPVPAASEGEPTLKRMPRLLVLSSIGTLMEYAIADDRSKAECEAVVEEVPLAPPVSPLDASASKAPYAISSGLPRLPSAQQVSPAAEFHAASRVRQRPTSVGSRSDVEGSDTSDDGDSADADSVEDSVTFGSTALGQGQFVPIGSLGVADANDESDTGNREGCSDDYEGEVDTEEDNSAQGVAGRRFSFSSVYAQDTTSTVGNGRMREAASLNEPFGASRQFKPSGSPHSPPRVLSAAVDMKERMNANLTSAIQAAGNPDPTAQLRSVHLEMEEEIAGVRRVSDGMHEVLEEARGRIACELDTISARILELRLSISSSVKEQEQRHRVASECMKETVSIGRDMEEAILLFRASGAKQLHQHRGLGAEAVLVDERLDAKESEVHRALASIEDKLERPIKLNRGAGGSRDTAKSLLKSRGFDNVHHVDTSQQLFSSLSLQGARIKRVLAMLGAMEAQFSDHRRMLRGRIGSEIGLSQARLEKLSLSGSQQSVRPGPGNPRSARHRAGVESVTSKAAIGLDEAGLDACAAEGEKYGPGVNQLAPEICRALRDIAMRSGREKIRVHLYNASSPLLGGEVTAAPATSRQRVGKPPVSNLQDTPSLSKEGISATSSKKSFTPLTKTGILGRRGSGGMFTSTHLVRSGGHAFVGDNDYQESSQIRGNTRMRSSALSPSLARSGEKSSRSFRDHSPSAKTTAAPGTTDFEFGEKPAETTSVGRSKPPGGFNFGSKNAALSGSESSFRENGGFSFGDMSRGDKKPPPFTTPIEALPSPKWTVSESSGHSGTGFKPAVKVGERKFGSFPSLGRSRAPTPGTEAALASSMSSPTVKTDARPVPESIRKYSTPLVDFPRTGSSQDAAVSTFVPPAGSGKNLLPSAGLPPAGSENDVVPSASLPPAASVGDFLPRPALPPIDFESDAVLSASSPLAGAEADALPIAALPPAGLEKDAVPRAALPPTGSETDAIPTATLPPTGPEKDGILKAAFPLAASGKDVVPKAILSATEPEEDIAREAALSQGGLESDSVPEATLPSKGSESNAVPTAALPPDGSEKDVVPKSDLPPSTMAKGAIPKASLPPAGSEGDAVRTATSPTVESENDIVSTASSPPAGSKSEVVLGLGVPPSGTGSPSFPFGGTSTSEANGMSSTRSPQSKPASFMPPDGSENDVVSPFESSQPPSNFQQAAAFSSSTAPKADTLQAQPTSSLSFSTTGFCQQSPAASSIASGKNHVLGDASAFQSLQTPGFASTAESTSVGVNLGSLGLGGDSKSDSTGIAGGLFGTAALPGTTSPDATVPFGGPTPLGQATEAPAKLNPSPFASSSANESNMTNPQGLGLSFPGVSPSPFEAVQTQTASFLGGLGSMEPQKDTAVPTTSSEFSAPPPTSAQFGSSSGFGMASQQSFLAASGSSGFGAPASSATFGASSGFGANAQPSASFGSTSGFGFGQSVTSAAGNAFGQPSSFGQQASTTSASGSAAAPGQGAFGSNAPGFQPSGLAAPANNPVFGSASPATTSGFAALASQTASAFGASPFAQGSPAAGGNGFCGVAPSQSAFVAPQGTPQSAPFGQSAFGQSSDAGGGFGQQSSAAPDSSFTSPAFTQRRG